MSDRRVVVTGLGAVTPLGASVGDFWDGLISSRSGVATITHFDASQFDVRFGGHCDKFDVRRRIDHRLAKRMDRFTQLAYSAALEAYESSGLKEADLPPDRGGVMLGTGIGGISEFEEQFIRLREKGPSRVSAFTIPKLMANAVAGHISIALNFQAGGFTIATACASAGSAMIEGYHAIRRGEVDVVVTGGSEAALTPLGLAAFAAMKALSTRNNDPQRASRPFDKDRDGFVLGEGAGILIFEDLEHARKRDAHIFCEVVGCGSSSDASDMVQPESEGRGAARAIRAAIASAGINADEIDYVNAHGTSTPLGDVAETRAIKSAFGPAARHVAVSSTKSAIGHLLGASAGVEAIASIKAIEHKTLPPTINLANPDPECDLDYVPNTARDANVNTVLNNSFGFGGHNTCVVFRRF